MQSNPNDRSYLSAEEKIRLECLNFAVTSVLNASKSDLGLIINRAKEFERFVQRGN